MLYASRGDDSVLDAGALVPRTTWSGFGDRDLRSPRRDAWRTRSTGVEEPTLLAPSGRGRELPTRSGELRHELDADTTARLSALPRALGVTVNTIVQVAWGVVLGPHHRQRRRRFRYHRVGTSGRSARRRVDGGFVHQHHPGAGAVRSADAVSEVLARVQAEQAGLLDHHHLGSGRHPGRGRPGRTVRHAVVFESYPVDAEGIRSRGRRHRRYDHRRLRTVRRRALPAHACRGPGRRTRAPGRVHSSPVRRGNGRCHNRTARPNADGICATTGIGRRRHRRARRSGARPTAGAVEFVRDGHRRGRDSRRSVRAGGHHERRPHCRAVRQCRIHLRRTRRAGQPRRTRPASGPGVGPESLVAVALPRSVDLVVALLATSEGRRGVLPMDPSYPADRIEFMLADADRSAYSRGRAARLPYRPSTPGAGARRRWTSTAVSASR